VSFKNEGSMLTETDSNKMIELANSIGQMPTLESEAISDDKLGVIVQIIEDNSEMDSGFQSRPESNQGKTKKKIYKDALVINNMNLGTPKAKRIHDSVNKVFGSDDPPPGFGLIYPKYYYLEQKRPQPMEPLKVWRGFNGNIYFEPIQFQRVASTDKIARQEQTNHVLARIEDNPIPHNPAAPIRKAATSLKESDSRKKHHDYKYNRSKTDFNINSKSFAAISSTFVHQQAINNSNQRTESTLTDNGDPEELIFITQHPIDSHREFEPVRHENTFNHSEYNLPKTAMNDENNNKPTRTKTNVINQMLVKGDTSNNKLMPVFTHSRSKKAPIQPNTNAVSKGKLPLKGLAYKEAKSRILDAAGGNANSFTATEIDDGYLEHLNKLSQIINEGDNQRPHYNNINDSAMRSDKKRVDYKEMMRKIRKGVTLNATIKPGKQNGGPQLPPARLIPRSERTTSAYMNYSHKRSLKDGQSEFMTDSMSVTNRSDNNWYKASQNNKFFSLLNSNSINENANKEHINNVGNSLYNLSDERKSSLNSDSFNKMNSARSKKNSNLQVKRKSYTQKDINATKLPLILSPSNLK